MKYKLSSPGRGQQFIESSELDTLLQGVKADDAYIAHVRRLYNAATGLYRYALLSDECGEREYPVATYSVSAA